MSADALEQNNDVEMSDKKEDDEVHLAFTIEV